VEPSTTPSSSLSISVSRLKRISRRLVIGQGWDDFLVAEVAAFAGSK